MWFKTTLTLIGISIACLNSSTAQADIIVVSGDVVEIAPPASVGNNDLTSDLNAFIFFETTRTIPTNMVLDTGNIAPNTTLSSFFLHADEDSNSGITFSGSITFSNDILGVASTPGILNGTEAAPFLFVSPTTDYSDVLGGRGFEGFDNFSISPDLRTITFETTVAGGQDQLRIFTAVPEPGSIAALCFGCAFALRRRRS